jgi:hypothetical protein
MEAAGLAIGIAGLAGLQFLSGRFGKVQLLQELRDGLKNFIGSVRGRKRRFQNMGPNCQVGRGDAFDEYDRRDG